MELVLAHRADARSCAPAPPSVYLAVTIIVPLSSTDYGDSLTLFAIGEEGKKTSWSGLDQGISCDAFRVRRAIELDREPLLFGGQSVTRCPSEFS